MSSNEINVTFHYEDEDDVDGSVQFRMPQVPRVGERVTLIWGNYASDPYNTRLEGVVEKVSWEVNSRRTNQDSDQVYASVLFEGEVKATPWKG